MNNYAVVVFTEEDETTGIVCLNWVSQDEKSSKYPNVATNEKRDLMIKRMEEPGQKWLTCPIRILRKFGRYIIERDNFLKRIKKCQYYESYTAFKENLEFFIGIYKFQSFRWLRAICIFLLFRLIFFIE